MARWLSSERQCATGAGLLAMALAFLAYAPSLGHDFCLMDDAYFVRENPVVQGGLSWAGIQAAWTGVHASYWAPLLWMSFMLDQELSGGAPWSFHLANVVFFALNVGLVFALVRRWTGRTGAAFVAALLWALHPARVESVAWITERKDLLSGLFFLAGLWFYTVGRGRDAALPASTISDPASPDGAARRPYHHPSTIHHPPSTANHPPSTSLASDLRPLASVPFLFLSWLCMLLGGMAKQVVVVMPAAMVLLDVWPLGRTDWNRFGRDGVRLVAEKWAFWLLGAAYAAVAAWTQAAENAITAVSVWLRLALIPAHYLFYLQKLAWPTALAPLQDDLPLVGWQVGLGIGAWVAATALLWRIRTKAPWALWAWLWFVGLLLPFSGVVWTGSERVAVRWLYLPQIGPTVAAVLAVAALGRGPWVRTLAAAALLLCGAATLRILNNWRDPNSFGLWIYECHSQQGGACAMGGDAYMAQGQWALAQDAFAQGVALGDKACFLRQAMVWNHLGHVDRTAAAWDGFERKLGRPLEGFAGWERAPERELFWRVRGQMLRAQGDYPGAIAALKEAVRWEPDPAAFVVAEFLRACHEGGRPEEGAEAAERMAAATGIRVRAWKDLFPCYVETWKMGARGYALGYFDSYAARHPDNVVELNYMAWLLATAEPDGLDHAHKDEWPALALRWAEQALAAGDGRTVGVWQTLAAAQANAGHFSTAVHTAEQARAWVREQRDAAVAVALEKQIMSYRMGLPWRE